MSEPLAGAGERRSGEIRPRVSVVIVHFRTPDLLRLCLEKIAEARIGASHEILVVDNAPLDSEAERLCRLHSARYLHNEKNVGFGRGVNRGLREGRGDFFLILNPDVEVSPGSVEELLAQMERDSSAGLVAPKLLYPDGTLQHSCRTFYTLPVFLLRRTFIGKLFPSHPILRKHLMLDYDHASTRAVDWCLGASLLARRSAVEDVGPMDDRFFLYFEDVDWCYRMAARGWKVLYHPASTMIHSYRRESARRPGKGLWIHLASSVRYYEKWSFILYWLKRRSTAIRRTVLVVSDLLAVNLAFILAYAARSFAGGIFENPAFGFQRYIRVLVFSDIVVLFAMALFGMYRSRRREEAGEQVLGALRAIGATGLIVMASTFLFFEPAYSRAVVGIYLILALVLVLSFRWWIFRAQGTVRSRRLHLRRIGILAAPEDARAIEERVGRHPNLGIELLSLTSRAAVLAASRGGDPAAIEEAVALWTQDERIAEIVLFEDWPGAGAEGLIERLGREGIPVRFIPRAWPALRHGFRVSEFFGYPALSASAGGPSVRSWEKRLFDVGAAALLFLIGVVPFLIARLGLLLVGRPLERTRVVGRRGKFLDLAALPGRWLKGAWFTPVREFPTLLLCLRGDWSLVGIAPIAADRWDETPEIYRRFPPDAPPGWVSLAGERGGSRTADRCGANLEYVGRWSLALDTNLILERLRRGRRMA